MAIYFIRHGQTYANASNCFAGQRHDTRLTVLGIQQARLAAQTFDGPPITRIISSSLVRARQTAAVFADTYGFASGNIETDDRLDEFNMGSFTGTPIGPISDRALEQVGDSESLRHFQNRIVAFCKQYSHCSDTILLVSHSGVYIALEALRTAPKLTKFYSAHPPPNGGVAKLRLDWLKQHTTIY